ncbi:MAG: bifunctional phosphoglucose/phosphomannose isomerase [Candidatus Omnitrophica bacterium]|nr:bifunctional phosphoglucose/phosphomannose isomerase [Candidatus Omnitrophota bacterium]
MTKLLLKDYLLGLPDQIPAALQIGKKVSLPKNYKDFSSIFFCGMGGSAISGNILRVVAQSKVKVPWAVHRSGGKLPHWVGKNTLAVFSSYSGNTREVLDSFQQALKRGVRSVVITSGGELEKQARKKRVPLVKIPGGFVPRCAIGYLTFSLFPVLKKIGLSLAGDSEIQEARNQIKKVSKSLAKNLARRIGYRYCHFYAISGLMEAVAIRWRSQFAENAKALSSHLWMPEMFHNEIEGWQFPRQLVKQSAALFFRDRDDSREYIRKAEFAESCIRRRGAVVLRLSSKGRSPLARIFSLIALGDWVSYELAGLYQVNPMPIPILDAIKKIKRR